MSIWEAVVLGVVQGVTEFLPISSTAHLVVVRTWLGHASPDDAFTTAIQLGTLFAVVGYFSADLLRLVRAVWADVRTGRLASTPDSRLAWLIGLGSVPVVLVGLVFKKALKSNFYNLPAMGVVAIVFAVLMWVADRRAGRRRVPDPLQPKRPEVAADSVAGAPPGYVPAVPVADAATRVSTWQAIVVGLWQALALMPGASRSGTTITGGLLAGMTRPAAARFSFLLSIPSVAGAGVKDLYDEYKLLRTPDPEQHVSLFASPDEITALLVGTLVSGLVGYLAIAGLLRFLTRYSLVSFVIYRLAFGLLLLLLAGLGTRAAG